MVNSEKRKLKNMLVSRNVSALLVLLFLMASSGCSPIKETVKTVWGSSIRPLENARQEAVSKTYSCDFDSCYDEVLSLSRAANEDSEKGHFDVFQKDPVKGFIVIMGLNENINTTEVGIFFEEVTSDIIKVEIASASTSAKEKISEIIFNHLANKFSEIK